jgi:hypothetical protein
MSAARASVNIVERVTDPGRMLVYDGPPDDLTTPLLGSAVRSAPRGVWTIRVGHTVRHAARARAARRMLAKLAARALNSRATTSRGSQ